MGGFIRSRQALTELIERDRQWRTAMAEGRLSDAYGMTSVGFQRSITLRSFCTRYRRSVAAAFGPPNLVRVTLLGDGEVWVAHSTDGVIKGGYRSLLGSRRWRMAKHRRGVLLFRLGCAPQSPTTRHRSNCVIALGQKQRPTHHPISSKLHERPHSPLRCWAICISGWTTPVSSRSHPQEIAEEGLRGKSSRRTSSLNDIF